MMDRSHPNEETLKQFRKILKAFIDDSGLPGVRGLESLAERQGKPHPRSTISAKLNGSTKPDWDFVKWILEAGSEVSGTSVNLASWRERHLAMVPPRSRSAASSAAPHQLPRSARAFVGRRVELDRLFRAIVDVQDATAVAITGMAGVGKTAMALHLAGLVQDQFPDGQLFYDLRGVDGHSEPADPAEVLHHLLTAVGAPTDRVPGALDQEAADFRTLTAGKRLLILLDNAAEESQVQPLIPNAPGTLVLITSRRRLTGLVSQGLVNQNHLDVFSPSEAVEHLVTLSGPERGRDEPAAARSIVAMCGYLPLAIALAGARAAENPGFRLAELATEMKEVAGSLDSFDRGPEQTRISTAFQLSHRGLPATAAALFGLLGHYPGPDFSVWTAASLLALSRLAAQQAVDDLTRASLVQEARPGRFSLHDLIRLYSVKLAAESVDADSQAAISRMIDGVATTAEQADRYISDSDLPAADQPADPGFAIEQIRDADHAKAWFHLEAGSLIPVGRLAARYELDAAVIRLAKATGHYLDYHGLRAAWMELHELALAAARRTHDHPAERTAHLAIAAAQTRAGDYGSAFAHLKKALAIAVADHDLHAQGRIHSNISYLRSNQGQRDLAQASNQRALTAFTESGSTPQVARTLNSIGYDLICHGEPTRGIEYCQQALALLTADGKREYRAEALDSIAEGQRMLGDFLESEQSYREAIRLYAELGDRFDEADSLESLAMTLTAAKALEKARTALEQALAIFEQLGLTDNAARVREKLEGLPRPSPEPNA